MSIQQFYGPDRFGISFELFPPKTEKGEQALFRHVSRLIEHQPSYITCTFGAGGSTQGKTLEIVSRVRREFDLPVATHLTCVGLTVDQLRNYLQQAWDAGVENIVALRGDPPKGDTAFRPIEGGLTYGNELVALIHEEFPGFGIAVGGYPEKHQEAPSMEIDLANLKRKVDAGAHLVITQLFYENETFFRFRDDCQKLGIDVPIVPGLLPITNFAQIQRITAMCGANLPGDLVTSLESAGEDADAQFRIGVEAAAKQTQALLDAGVPGLHFYVLNRSEAVAEVFEQVTMR